MPEFAFWPALLLLPVLYVYLWWLHRNTVTDMSSARKRFALAVRCVLVTALVLILAGMRIVRQRQSLAVMFVVDASRSIRDDQRTAMKQYISDAAKGMHPVDKAGLLTFAQDPHTQSSPGQPLDPSRLTDPGATGTTNIAQALRQAKNELDTTARDSGKRIVLVSDGNENADNALAETRELSAGHVLLDTVTVSTSLPKEALIEKTIVPSRVKIGEPFSVRVVVASTVPQTASVLLTRDGRPVGAAKHVDLHTGKNVVDFQQTIDHVGFYKFETALDAPQDTIAENNRGEGFVWVRGKPTILYVTDDTRLTAFLRNALKGQNIDVNFAPPEAMPTSAAAFQRYDSIFLSNVRAADLSLTQMTAIQVACRDFGIGFGMVGGENSFGAGGYRGTPIEVTLPVSMDVKKQKRLPSVAVALVIEDLEIPTTVNMSIEAAKATMDLLEPIDQVGVLDCNGAGGFGMGIAAPLGGTWRIPMQHVTDREALKVAMQRLTEMGDPPSYEPFLAEAARVLNNTDAKVKHIIFLGDGDAIFEQNQGGTAADIKRIRDMGITISTIATGAMGQNDVKFMASLAYLGGGQAYVADRPQDLPRLMLKDQMTISQPPIIEEPFNARPIDGDEVFKGIDWGSAPPLLGYNVSNLKETADLSLISHRNDPVFAGWRYGLGRSVAFLSDDRARWAAHWMGWAGYAKFWAQAVRWTLRPFAPSDYSTQVTMEGNRGHIVVDALDDQGRFVNHLSLRARVASPMTGGIHGGPEAQEQALRQTGPGRYEGWFDAPRTGTYLVNVLEKSSDGKGPERSTVVGLSIPYSPEYKDQTPNRYLMTELAQAAGGRADPLPSAVFGADRPPVAAMEDLTMPLLLLAMVLLPFDIAVRRLAIERADLQRAAAWIRRRVAGASADRTTTPELARLLDRKGAIGGAQEAMSRPSAGEGAARDAESPAAPVWSAPPPSFEPVESASRATASASRSRSVTLRPDVSGSVIAEEPAEAKVAPEEGAEGAEPAAFSRLMAAKRRAQERQDKDRDGR